MTWEQMQRAMAFLTDQTAKHDAEIADIRQAIRDLITVTNQDATNICSLANVAEAHERRIGRLASDRA